MGCSSGRWTNRCGRTWGIGGLASTGSKLGVMYWRPDLDVVPWRDG